MFCGLIVVCLLFNVPNGVLGQLSLEEKQELVDAHNFYRSAVEPKATNMEIMIWSDELGRIAQDFADSCSLTSNPNRVSSQSTFSTVGENMNVMSSHSTNYSAIVGSWNKQGVYYNITDNTCSSFCGSYKQLVWATSSNLGCGVNHCFGSIQVLICYYGPGPLGNVIDQPPYLIGSASCSACPLTKSSCHSNLCIDTQAEDSQSEKSKSHSEESQSKEYYEEPHSEDSQSELKSEESHSEESQSNYEEPHSEDSQSEESKSEESQSEEPHSEDSQSEESPSKGSKSKESQSEESHYEESQSEESEPKESKSEESKSDKSQSKSDESQYEESQSEESHSDDSQSEESHSEESESSFEPEESSKSSSMDMTFGADPHFSVVLPTGDMLCYSIQGRKDMVFNLITNSKLVMNALFVGDRQRAEVTWIGTIGLLIPGRHTSSIAFDARTRKVYIGNKVNFFANTLNKLTVKNGKVSVMNNKKKLKYPQVEVQLIDIGINLAIKFTRTHLDLFWHSTKMKTDDNSHGLVGQFFQAGVVIDKARKFLIMPNKEPVPVMRRPVWAFMERETKDDKLCWTAMNPGYQGEQLIDFTYMDYRVRDVYSDGFSRKLTLLRRAAH